MGAFHTPVLLQPACDLLDIKPEGIYIDATLGLGGHSLEIIRRGGIVFGLDQDSDALSACPDLNRLTKIHGNFMFLDQIAKDWGISQVDGVLFDLGLSSLQIETPNRGFSFQKDGPLDMRMDQSQPIKALDLVNTLPQNEISKILKEFGELPNSTQIAQKIISARPFNTTSQLAKLFTHFKTQQLVFQAFRITVNAELQALQLALPQAWDLLKIEGRIAVISFHSLEDRIVKHQFLNWKSHGFGQFITTKPVTPSAVEVANNPRSLSSKLRVIKKIC